MMIQIPSFLEAAYESVGLGVLLVAAIPTLLIVAGVIVGIARKRYGHRGEPQGHAVASAPSGDGAAQLRRDAPWWTDLLPCGCT